MLSLSLSLFPFSSHSSTTVVAGLGRGDRGLGRLLYDEYNYGEEVDSMLDDTEDSFDHEGSLHDGYSSYEASRATSGRVSPSDLPDSPSQTMQTSPRPGGSRAPPRPSKAPSVPPLAPAHQKSVYAEQAEQAAGQRSEHIYVGHQ